MLILREVLRWSAPEVADLLGTTVASVNSALQRARATLAARPTDTVPAAFVVDVDQQALLADYVSTFERYDIGSLVSLVQKDVLTAGSRRGC